MATTQSNSTKTQISEFELRQLARLCAACGVARQYDWSLCEECFKVRNIAAMERQWAKWGIAA